MEKNIFSFCSTFLHFLSLTAVLLASSVCLGAFRVSRSGVAAGPLAPVGKGSSLRVQAPLPRPPGLFNADSYPETLPPAARSPLISDLCSKMLECGDQGAWAASPPPSGAAPGFPLQHGGPGSSSLPCLFVLNRSKQALSCAPALALGPASLSRSCSHGAFSNQFRVYRAPAHIHLITFAFRNAIHKKNISEIFT